jgi:hypothetical protein
MVRYEVLKIVNFLIFFENNKMTHVQSFQLQTNSFTQCRPQEEKENG